MLACRNYAARVEHCFWVLPDRRADKKICDSWLCYVFACDELTGSLQPKGHLDRFSRFCRAQYSVTDRRDHTTCSVTIGSIYVRSPTMGPTDSRPSPRHRYPSSLQAYRRQLTSGIFQTQQICDENQTSLQ